MGARRIPAGLFPARRWALCLLVWLACWSAPGPWHGGAARAQRLRREYPIAPLRITDTSGEIGFEYDYFGEEQSLGAGASATSQSSNTSFQEYILYRLKGYVYHPRFLDFDTRFKLGLLQQRINREGLGADDGFAGFDGGSSNTFLNAYDIYLRFFKDHPLSLTLSASRDRTAILQLFTDRILLETESRGAALNWKQGPFPMDLSYNEYQLRETGFDSRTESTNRILEYRVRNQVGEWMRTEFRYRRQDLDQHFEADAPLVRFDRRTRLKSNEASLDNTIYFDRQRRSSLSSFLRYYDQSGTQELTNYFWQERLRLRHTDHFSTYYLASLLRNEFESTEVDTRRWEAGLDHRLYRSLDTHFDIHGRSTDYDGLSDDERGVTGRLAYRKQTPWGYLLASYAHTVNRIERTGAAGRGRVFDEALTADFTTTVFLANPGVIRGTIFVTDTPDGAFPFVEDLDYTVEERGNRTGIRLRRGGRIPENTTVYVDYEFQLTSDLNYTTHDQDFYLRYDFARALQGLAVYYRWHDLSPSGVEGDNLSVLEFTDQLLGYTYDWRNLTWTQEFRTYRSNFTNYDQTFSQIEGFHRVLRTLKWSWHAGLQTTQYDDEEEDPRGDESRIFFAGSGLNGPISNRGYWEMEARINKETGLVEETFLGLSGRLGMRWRRSRIEAGMRWEQRERFDDTRDRTHLFFQFAREF